MNHTLIVDATGVAQADDGNTATFAGEVTWIEDGKETTEFVSYTDRDGYQPIIDTLIDVLSRITTFGDIEGWLADNDAMGLQGRLTMFHVTYYDDEDKCDTAQWSIHSWNLVPARLEKRSWAERNKSP